MKPNDPARSASVCCSFCGKSQHEVRKLIAGPQAAICDECIGLCVRIIEEEARTRGRPEDSADAAARWFEGEGRSSSGAQTQIDPARPEHLCCSFCSKPHAQEVRKAASQVFICDGCVRLCADIVEEDLSQLFRPPTVN